MKNKIIGLLIILIGLLNNSLLAQRAFIDRNQSGFYTAGQVKLRNGVYSAELTTSGYLEVYEDTPYGKLKINQFPRNGFGKAGNALVLWGGHAVNNQVSPCWYCPLTPGNTSYYHLAYIGSSDYTYNWGKIENTIIALNQYSNLDSSSNNPIGTIRGFGLGTDGRLYLESTKPNGKYNVIYADKFDYATYTASIRKKQDIVMLRPFSNLYKRYDISEGADVTDMRPVTYFSTGKITMTDNCIINPTCKFTYTSRTYTELLPGTLLVPGSYIDWMGTTITGSILIKPLLLGANGNARSTNDSQNSIKKTALNSSNFEIYPNPTTGNLTIKIDNDDAVKNIYIYDLIGRSVAQFGEVTTFSVESLPKGTYIYNIETNNNKFSGKIVKE